MTTAVIQKIYLGLLGRPADAEGLAYWNEEIENGSLTLEQLRANIVNEQLEFANGPGQLSREDFVAQLYVKMFGREPDDQADYWLTGEGANVNLDQLVMAFTDGASDEDTVALSNRTTIAQQITNANLALEDDAATLLQGVTNDPATVTAAQQAIEASVSGAGESSGGNGGGSTGPSFTAAVSDIGVVTFGGTATGDISVSWADEVGASEATFSRGGVTAPTKPDFSGTTNATKISVASGQPLVATAAQVNGVTIEGAGTVKVSELENATSADFQHIAATLDVSVGATANVSGANLTTVVSLRVDDGDDANAITATLTAAQAHALAGKVTKGTDDKIAATVSGGSDLTALNLSDVDTITVPDGATVTATVAQAGKISLGTNSAYHLKDTAAALAGVGATVGNGATNISATDGATVAQATTIAAFTNGGTTSYGLSDTADHVKAADQGLRSAASAVEITEGTFVDSVATINSLPTLSVSGTGAVQVEDGSTAITEADFSTGNLALVDTARAEDAFNGTLHTSLKTLNLVDGVSNAVTLGAAGQNVTGGTGNDSLNVGTFAITGTINGGGGTDTLQMGAGSSIRQANVSGIETLELTDNGTVEMTSAQHNAFTTITATGDADTIKLSGTASVTANSAVETYEPNGGITLTLTASHQNVWDWSGNTIVIDGMGVTGTFSNFGGTATIVAKNGVDISGANNGAALASYFVPLVLDGHITMTAAQYEGFHEGLTSKITASGDADQIIFADGDYTKTFSLAADVETWVFGDDTGDNSFDVNILAATQSVTANSTTDAVTFYLNNGITNFTGSITGQETVADTLVLADGQQINDATISGVTTLHLTGTATMSGEQYNAVSAGTITAAGASDAVVLTTAGTFSADAAIESYTLDGAGNDQITFTLRDAGTTAYSVDLVDGKGSETVVLNNKSVDSATETVTISNLQSVDTIITQVDGANRSTGNFYADFYGQAVLITGDVIEWDKREFSAQVTNASAPNIIDDFKAAETPMATEVAGNLNSNLEGAEITVLIHHSTEDKAGIYMFSDSGDDDTKFDKIELIGVIDVTYDFNSDVHPFKILP